MDMLIITASFLCYKMKDIFKDVENISIIQKSIVKFVKNFLILWACSYDGWYLHEVCTGCGGGPSDACWY